MAPAPFLQFVYVSAARRLMDPEGLGAILEASRRNNPARGVTGALLYADGTFMQVLEGPPEAVDELYDRIAVDPRHRNLIPMLRVPVATRAFPDWSMGLVRPEDLPEGDRSAARALSEFTAASPDRALRLLASFGRLAASRSPFA